MKPDPNIPEAERITPCAINLRSIHFELDSGYDEEISGSGRKHQLQATRTSGSWAYTINGQSIHTSPFDRFNLMVRSSFDTLEIFGICKCSEYVVIKRCEKPMFAYSHVLADQDGSSYELQCCRKTVCCPLRSHSPASSFSGSYIQT